MRYTPHTPADLERMLATIGLRSVDELYRHIPQTLRQRLMALAARNANAGDWSFFLGGGIYHHFVPSAVDAIISRSEFATSYTPYQPEVSQGTLQALFEYQTLICQL